MGMLNGNKTTRSVRTFRSVTYACLCVMVTLSHLLVKTKTISVMIERQCVIRVVSRSTASSDMMASTVRAVQW